MSESSRDARADALAAAIWAERATRFGSDRVFLVRYEGPGGPRSFDWFGYGNEAKAVAARLYGANVQEVPR